MIKIFRCCRRLLCNKFSSACWRCCCSMPDRCSAVALPAWPIRPLSPWSRGLPWAAAALCVGGPVLPHLFTSAQRRAAVLTAATPADPGGTPWPAALPPWGVALLCLEALAPALLYARLFGWTDGSLALPALVILGPSGVRPGQRLAAGPPAALAALCVDAPPFALAAPLPEALGLWNGGLCTSYPLTLGCWTRLSPSRRRPGPSKGCFWLPACLFAGGGKGEKVYNQ